jgi:DNA-binding NarL/FixJ family response regulator
MQEERNLAGEAQDRSESRKAKKAGIHLLIVDDHAKYRAELRRLLQEEPDITICGEAEDEAEAVRLARRLKPDVILMDLEMAEDSSVQAVRDICAQQPNIRVVLMVLHNDNGLVLEGLRAGAWGHISKFTRPADFARVVRRVHTGYTSVDGQIMGRILEDLQLS